MALTLNQVLLRIKTIAEAHNQVRSYQNGEISELFNDKTTKYVAVALQYVIGNVNIGGHQVTTNFSLMVCDLVNVSKDTRTNEDDVLSDTFSILMDLITQLNHPNYNDWRLSLSNNASAFVQRGGDMYAGWTIEFSISWIFPQNICEVPTDINVYEPTDNDYRVYDHEYIATGLEGTTLTISLLNGKYILHVIREGEPLHKVSNLPDSAEFTTNMVDIGLGVAPNAGERFLILYRNPS